MMCITLTEQVSEDDILGEDALINTDNNNQ